MNMWSDKMRGVRGSAFAIAVCLVAIGGSSSWAALVGLVPNQTLDFSVTPAVDTAGLPTGGMVDSESFPLFDVGGANLSGTLTSSVWYDTNADTTLDFVYTLANTGTGDSFDGLTIFPFGTFTTNVGYKTGGVDPSGADRSLNGQNIDWKFVTTTIAPGQSSDALVVQTNATTWTKYGGANVIDGGTAQTGAEAPYLGPSVPEPASIGLIVLSSGIMLGRRRRRA